MHKKSKGKQFLKEKFQVNWDDNKPLAHTFIINLQKVSINL